MAKIAIEIRGVTKRYGQIEALDGIDLTIHAGEIFGLIGHNGAGKSTLFKLMLGLLPATSGEIRIDQSPVWGERFRRVRRHLGYLPENVALYDNLSGLETLEFFASLKNVAKTACGPMLERVGLADALERRVNTYSNGMRQRLSFAQALLGNPRMLFLDEPTNGLDPEGVRQFYRILHEQREDGATIVITSHILSEIQQRVDRLAIMKTGRIHALGTVAALREEMNLPVSIELRVATESQSAVRGALARIAGVTLEANGDGVSVRCARETKMAVLEAVSTLGDRITDLHIHEPTLEDVFFGYSG